MYGLGIRHAWRILLLIPIIIVSLAATTITAYAVFRVINLNDNAVAANWQSTPVYSSTCSNGSINNQDEVKNAWITNSDPAGTDGGWYYFRIETCTGPALSTSSIMAAIQFDCNNDGDFIDPLGSPPNFGDRKVLFAAGNEFMYYLSGSNQNAGGGTDPWGTTCSPSSYHGERPTGSNANVEWGFQFCDMPPGCRGGDATPIPIHFQIGTANITTQQPIDLSPVLQYSSPPTAVTLRSFNLRTPFWQQTVVLGGVSAGLITALIGLIVLRRRLKV
jgi:hypothetical protein